MACSPLVPYSIRDDHQKEPKKPMVRKSCLITDLPSEIIIRIIARLPLKSLFQCRVVCKKLHKIISDPYLSRIYSQDPPFTTFLVSLWPNALPKDKIGLYLIEISENGEWTKTPFNQKIPSLGCSSSNFKLQGSFNGLLCFQSLEDGLVHIWNPIWTPTIGLDSCIILPNFQKVGFFRESYVCGYSSGINKFKVLKLFFPLQRYHQYVLEIEGWIFTLGDDDMWRRLPLSFGFDPLNYHRNIESGVFFSGVYHWLSTSQDICTFDFGEEKHGIMSCPCGPTLPRYKRTLIALNDRLSVFEYLCYPHRLALWIMKEYGVEESWTRIDILESRIPFEALSADYPFPAPPSDNEDADEEDQMSMIADIFPAALLVNGDIVLSSYLFRDKLIFYDPKLMEAKDILDFKNQYIRSKLISYTPFLGPPSLKF